MAGCYDPHSETHGSNHSHCNSNAFSPPSGLSSEKGVLSPLEGLKPLLPYPLLLWAWTISLSYSSHTISPHHFFFNYKVPVIAHRAQVRRTNSYLHTHTYICSPRRCKDAHCMCYFVKLGFSSKKMNVLNFSLSLENTFLKGLLFSFADHPPHHPDSALSPGEPAPWGGSEP